MKKHLLFLLVSMISLMFMPKAYAAEKEIYACMTTGGDFQLRYDDKKTVISGVIANWTPEEGSYRMTDDELAKVKKIVINGTMSDARPTTMSRWFYKFSNATEIAGFSYLNTSEVTSMFGLFYHDSLLTKIPVQYLNTENVKNMKSMFVACTRVESLNLSGFVTDKVTDMSYMFKDCHALKEIDIPNFNTSEVKSMNSMFYNCYSLTALDLSHFNTEKVTDMGYLFYYCSMLEDLNISSFNTKNVTFMRSVFAHCENLGAVDLRGFYTDNVVNTEYMFYKCAALTELNLPHFRLDQDTVLSYMFSGCTSLQTIVCNKDWSDLPLSPKSTDMFANCTSLVGGNGTVFEDSKKDCTYARPDDPANGKPGYFTGVDTIIVEDGWAHYDNGIYESSIGWGGSGDFHKYFQWAIRIPAGTVTQQYMDKVELVCPNPGELNVLIYQGGDTPDKGTLLHSQTIQSKGSFDFQEFMLTPSVGVDPDMDLWLVAENDKGIDVPAGFSVSVNAADARWVFASDRGEWMDTKEFGYSDLAWMLRAHFADVPLPQINDVSATNIQTTSADIQWEGFGDMYQLRYRKLPVHVNNDFSNGLGDWIALDADQDGYTWTRNGLVAQSFSYDDAKSQDLTPDNFLISPRINLGGVVSFKAWGQDQSDFAEHFCIMLSTADKAQNELTADDFVQVSEEWIIQAPKEWEEHSLDLSEYAGKQGYVAIRHYNTKGQFILMIDDIVITETGVDESAEPGAWTNIPEITAKTQTLTGLDPDTKYEVQVRALSEYISSDWSPSVFFITAPEPDEQGLEQIISSGDENQYTKFLYDGQLYIMYKGTMYDVQGKVVRQK